MNVHMANTEEDMQKVREIRSTVFIDEQNVPPEEEWDQYEKESVHLLAQMSGEWAGAGRVRFHEGVGKAERICVLKAFRGTGLGKELMHAVEDYVAEQGGRSVILNAQTRAKNFYERLGYKVTSGEFLDAGIPHVAMEKVL
ncbi:GNAT family N-acetyltransferase [Natribacillus halophilus]|uniref:Predicted N-acyltransferase, GNAT family n=1 Tax=Natribacillus halophilus TaxID=549003 RepID=A0A1G8LE31_9BACI|nr:GNAT family N-acetyltransferase [Natribacillus halophilus]SDI53915.1 Predicted N-acyltransferase, GNAT family [Natribacillus halophilus]